MGASKDPNTYPKEFQELYDASQSKDISFELESEAIAINTMQRLHSYRRALEINNIPGSRLLRNITISRRSKTLLMKNTGKVLSDIVAKLNIKTDAPTDKEIEARMQEMDDLNLPANGEQNEL